MTEAQSHFALWAMLNAPLLIGADLRKTPDVLMGILRNSDIIALKQDPAGNQATVAYDSSDLQILVKSLASGDKAVAVFNRGSGACEVTLQAAQLKYRPDQPVELTDLWKKQQCSFTKEVTLRGAPRETLVFRARGARADSTPYGQTLQVARKTYSSGIGILANSRLEVRNAGY